MPMSIRPAWTHVTSRTTLTTPVVLIWKAAVATPHIAVNMSEPTRGHASQDGGYHTALRGRVSGYHANVNDAKENLDAV